MLGVEGFNTGLIDWDSETANSMWYASHLGITRVDETAAGVFQTVAEIIPVDTRAMRKVTSVGMELKFILQETSGDAGFNLAFAMHTFVKFP